VKVAVIGAGSWGTALARLVASNGCDAWLWDRDRGNAAALDSQRENTRYLPGYRFPDSLHVSADLGEAVSRAELVVLAVPSDAVNEVSRGLASTLHGCVPLLNAAKGLESHTGRRLSEVLADNIPGCAGAIAALSGPNLAVELAAGVPTATVVASRFPSVPDICRRALACAALRVYSSDDIVGVEMAGALKNLLAIAAGISEGMGFGDNTKAALLTRGLAEMTRLGTALGARASTFSGLSGVGDLFATASSHLSRNLRVGIALGQGMSLQDILNDLGQVAEGVPTTRAAVSLAARTGVDMPIAAETHAILFEGRPPREGLANLMARQGKDESA
jgi:glycerol-3-phosphate dehydrogenase (NAD(P)+)